MPHFIIKPVPSEDFYVDWSTITDCPAAWGTRETLAAQASRTFTPDRFARADLTGSSSLIGLDQYGAGDLWVANIGDSPFYVERQNLRAFCESLDPWNLSVYDETLTKPWDDPDEDTETDTA